MATARVGRVSPRPPDTANDRPVRPNAFAIICFASCELTLATVRGLTGCSYVRDAAVSERHPLPPPSPDCYQNHELAPSGQLICNQHIRLPPPSDRGQIATRKVTYEINQGFACRSGFGRHSGDRAHRRIRSRWRWRRWRRWWSWWRRRWLWWRWSWLRMPWRRKPFWWRRLLGLPEAFL